jgi:hypothetical protein
MQRLPCRCLVRWRLVRAADDRAAPLAIDISFSAPASSYLSIRYTKKGLILLSSTPKILKSRRRQFRIANGMLDILMAEVGLQGPSVLPLVGKGVASGMPKHVRMGFEPELRYGAGAFHHARQLGRTEW